MADISPSNRDFDEATQEFGNYVIRDLVDAGVGVKYIKRDLLAEDLLPKLKQLERWIEDNSSERDSVYQLRDECDFRDAVDELITRPMGFDGFFAKNMCENIHSWKSISFKEEYTSSDSDDSYSDYSTDSG